MSRITNHLSHFLYKIDAGLIIAALLALFIVQSLLKPGLPAGADISIHFYRAMEYERAWAPGVIVPRWAPNLAFGYGYPLFVFAPPLPYWLVLGFHGLGLNFEISFKAFIILTIMLYAVGMYLLVRDALGSVQAALVASTAYAFAPFALREAILFGGNMPQFLATALFPWTLWAMSRIAYTRSWKWVILAAMFYAGIMLSHLFIVLIFTPVAGLFGVVLFWLSSQRSNDQEKISGSSNWVFASTFSGKINRVIKSSLPILALSLGLLLSAFFWIPAFLERTYTRAQADIYLEKSPFYVRYPYWTDLVAWIYPLDARAANPYVPLTLGVVTLILAALGLLAGLWLIIKRRWSESGISPGDYLRSPVYFIFFFAVIGAVAIFLALPISRPIWDIVTILQVAEFPWRFLSLANLGLAFLAGVALLLPPPKFRWPIAIICLVVQILAVAPFLYPVVPFAQYDHATIADQVYYERRSQSVGTTGLSEYLPLTVSKPPTTSPLVEVFEANQFPERLDRGSLPVEATATLLKQNAVNYIYQIDSPVDFSLRLFQFDYPGWRAWVDDRPITIVPEVDTGFILVDVPAGQHTVAIHFGETPGRVVSIILTLVTIVGIVIVSLYLWRRKSEDLTEGQRESKISLVFSSSRRNVRLILSFLLLVVVSLWVMPLLRPIFTIQSPPDRVLVAQHETDIKFDLGIRLVGYDLEKNIVSPGERLQVVLYWETDIAPIKANLQPFVHLDRLNNWITIADATNYIPGDVTTENNMPTFHWDTARYVRDKHDLYLPPDVPPQAYAVRVGLIDPDQNNRLLPLADGSGDTAYLTTINVSTGRNQQANLVHPLNISFGGSDTIRLTGFQLDEQTSEQLNFTLAWESDETPQKDYTVFAQLLNQDQNLVASFDRPPLDGAYPTSTWLSGQTITDPRYIPLDDVPSGEYHLIVGLYDPLTQQRLVTDQGADFVELTVVSVKR